MVTIKNLSFAFKKGDLLFNNLNMELQAGRTYGLFGLNGAGKTTLLNHISGMLFPLEGSCIINGHPSQERRPETLSDLIIVPEQFELPPVKPTEYIDLHSPFYPNFDEEQMKELMERFTLDSSKLLSKQSYGQRKKFLISFALAANTRTLLLDEPTNGLDIPSKSQFRKVMAATGNDERCTVISTHQVRDLESMIDKVTVLHNGSIIFDQTIESISDSLVFKRSDSLTDDAIYSEEVLGGYQIISKNSDGRQDQPIDLEMLFNATIETTEKLNQAFIAEEVQS